MSISRKPADWLGSRPSASGRVPASDVDVKALELLFQRRRAVIGIVGLGYVGLPLALATCAAGYRVIGFDTNGPRVSDLNRGISHLKQISNERIRTLLDVRRFEASDDFHRLTEPNAILICVPTPLGPHYEPDLSHVETTTRNIAATLHKGQLVILESTSFPGTTREVVRTILETSGLRSGIDFFLGYSPEREDPGNIDFETPGIPKIVAGDGDDALRLTKSLYDQIVVRTVPVSSLDAAEAVKLTENIFRAVNIALVNELKIVFHAMQIDIFEVIEAARTKPFGYMPFYPGPGLGGHCIPIDPFYLTWKAREHAVRTRFIELAGEINTSMPYYVVQRTAEELDRQFGKGLNGSHLLIIGVAYKKNVDDTRESPALTIMDLLEARGAIAAYHDPHVPIIPSTRAHGRLTGRKSVNIDRKTLSAFDAVLVITDHDAIDWDQIAAHARLVVDTRNRIRRTASLCSA